MGGNRSAFPYSSSIPVLPSAFTRTLHNNRHTQTQKQTHGNKYWCLPASGKAYLARRSGAVGPPPLKHTKKRENTTTKTKRTHLRRKRATARTRYDTGLLVCDEVTPNPGLEYTRSELRAGVRYVRSRYMNVDTQNPSPLRMLAAWGMQ